MAQPLVVRDPDDDDRKLMKKFTRIAARLLSEKDNASMARQKESRPVYDVQPLKDHDLLVEINVKVETLRTDFNSATAANATRIEALATSKADKADVDDLKKKVERLMWLAAAGVGILGTIQFVIGILPKIKGP